MRCVSSPCMNVLFSIIPGHGHFFPCLPLAGALRQAGHRVQFATAASYGEVIRRYGFDAIAAGLDYTQGTVEGDDIRSLDDNIAHKMFVEGPAEMLTSIRSIISTQRPDAILADSFEFGGQVAAEAEGTPWGSVHIGVRTSSAFPGFWPFDFDERQAVRDEHSSLERIQRLRESAGLARHRLLEGERPYDRSLTLCMAPPSLEAWPLRWVSHTAHPLRPEIHRSDSDDGWLEGLPTDRPIVAVSFGTLFGRPDLVATAARSARSTGARVIVATKWDLGLDDDLIHTVPWVSTDRLMAVSDVLIHHGGWGSTVAAMASGTPSVVIPLAADQHFQASRLASVGAARSIGFKTLTSDGLQEAVEQVLADPVFLLNARRLQAEIDSMPTAADVVPLVERLAETGGPILNREPDEEI